MDSLNKLQCDRNQQFAMITRSEAIVPINMNCIRADLFVHLEHMNNAQACLGGNSLRGIANMQREGPVSGCMLETV